MGVYKYENQTIDGKEYIMMSSDLFYAFFVEYVSILGEARGINSKTVDEVKLKWKQTKHIKKKRVRLKREKNTIDSNA